MVLLHKREKKGKFHQNGKKSSNTGPQVKEKSLQEKQQSLSQHSRLSEESNNQAKFLKRKVCQPKETNIQPKLSVPNSQCCKIWQSKQDCICDWSWNLHQKGYKQWSANQWCQSQPSRKGNNCKGTSWTVKTRNTQNCQTNWLRGWGCVCKVKQLKSHDIVKVLPR